MAGLQANFGLEQRRVVMKLPKGPEKFLVKYLSMLLDRFTDYTVAHKARLLPPGASGDDYHIAPKKTHVCGPLSQYLLIPKNRYKLTLLPGQQTSKERGVGWLVEDNSPESYDSLWGEEENLNEFREVCGGVRRRENKVLAEYLGNMISEDATILEAGCAVGDLMSAIVEKFPNLRPHGFDFSARAIERIKARIPRGEFMVFNFDERLPFSADSFDLVYLVDLLEHIEKPRKLVEELVRVCRPGGKVVLVVPNGDVDDYCGHLWFWNKEQLKLFLSDWNTQIVPIDGVMETVALIEV